VMAGPIATLCNTRMERERQRVNERHEMAAENGRRGAEARWGRGNGVANGNPNGDPNGDPNGKSMAVTTTTTTTKQSPLTPLSRKGGGRKKALKELAEKMADPNWVPF